MSFTRNTNDYPLFNGEWLEKFAQQQMSNFPSIENPNIDQKYTQKNDNISDKIKKSFDFIINKNIPIKKRIEVYNETKNAIYDFFPDDKNLKDRVLSLGKQLRGEEVREEAERQRSQKSKDPQNITGDPVNNNPVENKMNPQQVSSQQENPQIVEEINNQTQNLIQIFGNKLNQIEKFKDDFISSFGKEALDPEIAKTLSSLRRQFNFMYEKQSEQYKNIKAYFEEDNIKTSQVKKWIDPRNWFNKTRRDQYGVDPLQNPEMKKAIQDGNNNLKNELLELANIGIKIQNKVPQILQNKNISEKRKAFIRNNVAKTISTINNILKPYQGQQGVGNENLGDGFTEEPSFFTEPAPSIQENQSNSQPASPSSGQTKNPKNNINPSKEESNIELPLGEAVDINGVKREILTIGNHLIEAVDLYLDQGIITSENHEEIVYALENVMNVISQKIRVISSENSHESNDIEFDITEIE